MLNIGLNARLFPNNWRPLIEEIEFAARNRFQSVHLSVRDRDLDRSFLGAELDVIAKVLAVAQIDLAIEFLIRIDTNGVTSAGKSPLDILKANLTALDRLQCRYVHWHLVPDTLDDPVLIDPEQRLAFERSLFPQLAAAVDLAQKHGFLFGLEHNEPDLLLFARPEACQTVLDAVPGLKFVWDVNHTALDDLAAIKRLVPKASIIHVSDTVRPELNCHLPLGKGTVDFAQVTNILIDQVFAGPAILEIGGMLKSGGFNQDTDEALIQSRAYLQQAYDAACSIRSDGV